MTVSERNIPLCQWVQSMDREDCEGDNYELKPILQSMWVGGRLDRLGKINNEYLSIRLHYSESY